MYTAAMVQNCGTKLFFFGTLTDLTVMGLYLCAHQQEPEKQLRGRSNNTILWHVQARAGPGIFKGEGGEGGGGGGPAGFFLEKKAMFTQQLSPPPDPICGFLGQLPN